MYRGSSFVYIQLGASTSLVALVRPFGLVYQPPIIFFLGGLIEIDGDGRVFTIDTRAILVLDTFISMDATHNVHSLALGNYYSFDLLSALQQFNTMSSNG